MPSLLKLLVIISFLFSLISLSILLLKTLSFGKDPSYARNEGSEMKGIAYALGRGLMPWEKESTRKHLPSYLAGIAFHMSIFAAILYLFLRLADISIEPHLLAAFRTILLIGFGCGAALLIKRMATRIVRQLSCPDDFIANILVDLFLILGLMSSFISRFQIPFLLIAFVLFLYAPFGKIRHCFLFFYTRIFFGRFFGRRGILPHQPGKMREGRENIS